MRNTCDCAFCDRSPLDDRAWIDAGCPSRCLTTYGLFCADGQRGVFTKDSDNCQRCGVLAMDHSTKSRCEEKR